MLLGTQGTPAQIKGVVGPPTTFRIKESAVSFDILSDALYTDKVTAVIRELSCNAWDAHKAAGRPELPFEVHLPTAWEPIFSITDFGTGLEFRKGGCETCHGAGGDCLDCGGTGDYDATLRLYCTYFSSSKQESNDFVGALGLGSKSPFAYTKRAGGRGGFSIVNRYNGQTFIYSAMVKDGLPTVVLMDASDTPDAKNGLEVSFPVTSSDVWEFENKACNVFEFFKPKPTLNKPITIRSANYSVKSALWGTRIDSDTPQGIGLRAIQGNVAYAVGNIDLSRLSDSHKELIGMPIDLFFEIGELSVAVSRESLQMDVRTIKVILARLDHIAATMMKEVEEELDQCQTSWEARLKIAVLRSRPGVGKMVSDALKNGTLFRAYTHFTFNDLTIRISPLDYYAIAFQSYIEPKFNRKRARKRSLFTAIATDALRSIAFSRISSGQAKKLEYDVVIPSGPQYRFVVNDTGKPLDRYLGSYFEDNDSIKEIYVIEPLKKGKNNFVKDETDKILEEIGNPEVVLGSGLKTHYDPIFKTQRGSRTKYTKIVARVLNRYMTHSRTGYSEKWGSQWERNDEHSDLVSSGLKFYILINGYGQPEQNMDMTPSNFIYLMNEVRASQLIPEVHTVFGLRSDSPFIGNPEFVEVFPYLKKRIEELVTPEVQLQSSLEIFPFSHAWESFILQMGEQGELPDTMIGEFAQRLHRSSQGKKSPVKGLANRIGIPYTCSYNFNDVWAKIAWKYPMLEATRPVWYSKSIHSTEYNNPSNLHRAFLDYIRMAETAGAVHEEELCRA